MVVAGGEMVKSFEGAAGPATACGLGDGEERTPVVRQTVVGGGRHGRVAGLENGEMVLSPASEFATEQGFNLGMEAVETGFQLVGLGGKKFDSNRRFADQALATCIWRLRVPRRRD